MPTETQAASGLAITLDDLREIVTLCLKHHQEQIQVEETARKKQREEEYEQEIAEKRRVAEAAGRQFIASAPEWFDLIHKTMNTQFHKIGNSFEGLDNLLRENSTSLTDLKISSNNILEHVTPTSPPTEPKPASLFANLPTGLRAKAQELRTRIKERSQTYLNGRYSFHRGYTLLTVILYGLMLAMMVVFRISISA